MKGGKERGRRGRRRGREREKGRRQKHLANSYSKSDYVLTPLSLTPSLSLPYHIISCIVGDGGGGVVDTGVARLDVGTFCLVVRALGYVIGQHGYVLEGVSEGEGKRRERGRGGREERGGRGER